MLGGTQGRKQAATSFDVVLRNKVHPHLHYHRIGVFAATREVEGQIRQGDLHILLDVKLVRLTGSKDSGEHAGVVVVEGPWRKLVEIFSITDIGVTEHFIIRQQTLIEGVDHLLLLQVNPYKDKLLASITMFAFKLALDYL